MTKCKMIDLRTSKSWATSDKVRDTNIFNRLTYNGNAPKAKPSIEGAILAKKGVPVVGAGKGEQPVLLSLLPSQLLLHLLPLVFLHLLLLLMLVPVPMHTLVAAAAPERYSSPGFHTPASAVPFF